jgi:hypothetical protein
MSSLVVCAMPYFADHSVLSDLISVCIEIPGEFSTQTVVNDDVSIQRATLIFGLESLRHMRVLEFEVSHSCGKMMPHDMLMLNTDY